MSEHGVPPSNDPAWDFARRIKGRNKMSCKLCGKYISGGITRLKQYLATRRGEVVGCRRVPDDVKEDMMNKLNEGRERRKVVEESTFRRLCENYSQLDSYSKEEIAKIEKRVEEFECLWSKAEKEKEELKVEIGRLYKEVQDLKGNVEL